MATASGSGRILGWLLLLHTVMAACNLLPLFGDSPENWLPTLQFWLFPVTAVTWLIWLSGAARRQALLDGSAQPGGLWLAWFLPGANLVWPYRVMRDLWIRVTRQSVLVVALWWLALLVWIAARINSLRFTGEDLFVSFSRATFSDLASHLAAFVVAALAYLMVQQMEGNSWRALTLPVVGSLAGGMVALTMLAGAGWFGPTPEQSIRALGDSYAAHDLAGFKTYFNTRAVLDNAADQVLFNEKLLKKSEEDSGQEGISAYVLARVFSGTISGLLKRFITPGVAWRFDRWVVTGLLPPGAYDNRYGLQILKAGALTSEAVRMGFFASLRRVEVVRNFGRTALVRADFGEPGNPMVSLTLCMDRVRNHWQIVAIRDIQSLFPEEPNPPEVPKPKPVRRTAR